MNFRNKKKENVYPQAKKKKEEMIGDISLYKICLAPFFFLFHSYINWWLRLFGKDNFWTTFKWISL